MSDPVQRFLAALREHGHEPRKAGDGWACRCPAHDDRNPSLSIHAGDDGRALVNCHAGCSGDAVCAAIGLRLADLFPNDPSRRSARTPRTRRVSTSTETRPAAPAANSVDVDEPKPVETFATARKAVEKLERWRGPKAAHWVYTDAVGEPVGLVVRWNLPPDPDDAERKPRKDIQPVSKLPEGWANKGMPTPRPLYRLRDLLATPAGSRVFIVEGEKAADACRAVGLVATTSPHGSNAAAKADWSPLSGRDVVILPDHDDAGETYADDVARLATAAGAKSVRVVRLVEMWAGMPKGGDMADLVEHRGGDVDPIRAEVEALAEKAPTTKPKPQPIDGAPVILRLADVEPCEVRWLWEGRIPRGRVSLLAGRPGEGKSMASMDWAARVTTGRTWPDGTPCAKGSVVLVAGEDDPADTIRPRLDAHGADVTRVHLLQSVVRVGPDGVACEAVFTLADLPALEATLAKVSDCALVIVDPIGSFIGGVDAHRDNQVRGVLAPLAALAQRTGAAVLLVAHQRKGAASHADDLVLGSRAFTGIARSVLHLMMDPDNEGRRLLLPGKSNLAGPAAGLAFTIAGNPPRIEWEPDPVDMTADGVLAAQVGGDGGGRTERDDAGDWLRDLLASGARSARDVERDARDAGFSFATVRRAKAAIGVVSRKPAFGGPWEWTLPAEDAQPPKMLAEDAHTSASERLGERHAESDANTSKMLTRDGVSALGDGERLGTASSAGDGWGEV